MQAFQRVSPVEFQELTFESPMKNNKPFCRNAFVAAPGGWATNIMILWCSAGHMVMRSFTT